MRACAMGAATLAFGRQQILAIRTRMSLFMEWWFSLGAIKPLIPDLVNISSVAAVVSLAGPARDPILSSCDSSNKDARDRWHERWSGFLRHGCAVAGTGLRRDRY